MERRERDLHAEGQRPQARACPSPAQEAAVNALALGLWAPCPCSHLPCAPPPHPHTWILSHLAHCGG